MPDEGIMHEVTRNILTSNTAAIAAPIAFTHTVQCLFATGGSVIL